MQKSNFSFLERVGSRLLVAVPYIWYLILFFLPFLIILKMSVTVSDGIIFDKLITYKNGILTIAANIGNYFYLAQDSLYLMTYIRSLYYAGITTLICLGIGFPFAYFLARSPKHQQGTLLMMVMLPFWTSFLLRIYAWKSILADDGVFNNVLMAVHIINSPIKMLHTPFSLILGMVYMYLPFMILPLYSNLAKLDLRLLEAAADLGSKPFSSFCRITIPLARGGIIAGSMLVFIPCVGEYVVPELLGGTSTIMIGRVLWDEFFNNNDWPMAATVAVVMIALVIGPLALFNRYSETQKK